MRVCNPKTIKLATSFNIDNPQVARWAEKNAARMITSVTNETKKAIRLLVTHSFEDGTTPAELARMIRPMIGLTQNQAKAVINARKTWLNAGVEREKVSALVEKYSAKLLRKRAIMIARTESIQAASQGQLASWNLAEKQGIIIAERTTRIWLPDASACDRCLYMAKQGPVGFKEPFITMEGKAIMAPPLHPHCECSVGLKFKN